VTSLFIGVDGSRMLMENGCKTQMWSLTVMNMNHPYPQTDNHVFRQLFQKVFPKNKCVKVFQKKIFILRIFARKLAFAE
jgi:hypothetical protein